MKEIKTHLTEAEKQYIRMQLISKDTKQTADEIVARALPEYVELVRAYLESLESNNES